MNVYLAVVDTLADWQIGYLTAELNSRRYFADPALDFNVLKVGISMDAVRSMGGLVHTPDLTIDALELQQDDVLLLPGSDIWTQPVARPILELARDALDRGHQVAAICSATVGLAQLGALNTRRHTSNDLGLLQQTCLHYSGQTLYRNEPAVRGDHLITASGLAPLEFSYEVVKMLKVWRPDTAKAWFRLHKTRQQRWHHELLASLS